MCAPADIEIYTLISEVLILHACMHVDADRDKCSAAI